MRKISTHELLPGMKVLDLDMPWLLHPLVYTAEGTIESPEQIAKICWFLASDESGFITGSEYIIDGGLTAL